MLCYAMLCWNLPRGLKQRGSHQKTFEFLAEDITSDYGLLLWLVNTFTIDTFTIDTDKYYPMHYKVNDAKTFKIFAYYFAVAHKSLHEYYRISLEGYQTTCVKSFFICKEPKSFGKYKPVSIQSGSPKKNIYIWWYGTQKLLKTAYNVYLYNYQAETATSLATKHEKTIMACSYLIFWNKYISFCILNFWPAML